MLDQKREKVIPREQLSSKPEAEPARREAELGTRGAMEQAPVIETVQETVVQVPVSNAPKQGALIKSPLLVNVEKILEEDLEQVYFTMQPLEKEAFKRKGDDVARDIEILVEKARATADRLIALLRAWLQMIPGVSRFFVEQSSKIKTDKLLRLQHKGK